MKHNFFTHLPALLLIGAVLAFASPVRADSKYYICKTAGSVCTVTNADYASKIKCSDSVNIYLETDNPGSTTGTCYATQEECRQACGDAPSFAPVSGSLQCTPINDSISLGASFYNGSNVSLFREGTLLTTFSGSTSSYQPFVDREDGLPGGVSRVYYLRNGATADSSALDKVSCVREKRQTTITVNVNGRGSVEGALSCSWVKGRCMQTFQEGSMFTLKAVPEEGSAFSGWSSLCGNTQLSECLLQASRDMSLTATFSKKTYPLSLSFGGAGSGRVEVFYGNSLLAFPSSGPASLTYPGGAAIKLVVIPAAGSLFVSWGGACAGTAGTTCMVEMNDTKSVSATLGKEPTPPPSQPVKILPVPDVSPTLPPSVKPVPTPTPIPTPVPTTPTSVSNTPPASGMPQKLTIVNEGEGSGRILLSTNATCLVVGGGVCTQDILLNQWVILTAQSDINTEFSHWVSGCYDTWQNVCRVQVNESNQVRAKFNSKTKQPWEVQKTMINEGSGTIELSNDKICKDDRCVFEDKDGSWIILTAKPSANSVFGEWAGCYDTWQNVCRVKIDASKTVRATFQGNNKALSSTLVALRNYGNGEGVVISYPDGTSCTILPADLSKNSCSINAQLGGWIILTATPNTTTSTFSGWVSGCYDTWQNVCRVQVVQGVTIGIEFRKKASSLLSPPFLTSLLAATILESEPVLTVKTDGLGKGTVTSHNGGIFCGAACSTNVAKDTFIILTAIPESADSFFHSWTGQCYDTWQNVCRVKMDSSKTITATFAPDPARVKFRVSINMDGVGTVESNPSGIACGSVDPTGSICASDFAIGTDLVLTATQRPGSTSLFSRWEGACTVVSGNRCTLRVDASKVVTARFDYPPLQQASPLDVRIVGKGSVESSDGEILCGVASSTASRCSRGYIYGTYIILTAVSDTESLFLNWSSGCVDVWKNTCRVRIDGPKTITATFQEIPQQKILTVVSYGPGSVRSDKTGIACGSDCAEEFAKGASVVLSATPQAGATFLGWSGACKGQESCAVTLDKARFVYARFRLVNAALSVKKKGFGTLTTIPAGIVCGNVCSSPYPTDTVVTLYATPLSGQVFSGWEGSDTCKGKEPRCTLQMNKNQSATAVFVPAPAF